MMNQWTKNSIQQRLVNNIVCKHNSDSSLIKLRRFPTLGKKLWNFLLLTYQVSKVLEETEVNFSMKSNLSLRFED